MGGILLLSSIRDEEESLDVILASKGIHIPRPLFFKGSFQDDRVYGEVIYNAPYEVSVFDEEFPYQKIAKSISKIVQELFVAGGNDFDAEKICSFRALSWMPAVLTVSDVSHDRSDRRKFIRRSNRPVYMQEKHRQRRNQTLTYDLFTELAGLIAENKDWPETYRLDGMLRPIGNLNEHHHDVEDLLTFYNGHMRLYTSLNNRKKYRGSNARRNRVMCGIPIRTLRLLRILTGVRNYGSTSDTYGRSNSASQRGSWQLRTTPD